LHLSYAPKNTNPPIDIAVALGTMPANNLPNKVSRLEKQHAVLVTLWFLLV